MTLSSPLKLVVVEDQPAIRDDVLAMLQEEPGITVAGACGTVREALRLITAVQPDLLLLDINLTDGTAFDILEQLHPFTFQVIFLTAHQEHAIRAIKYGALDYLLKPLDQEELRAALKKVQRSVQARTNHRQRMVLRGQDYLQVVELQEIVYCETDGGYTTFYLADGRKILSSRHLKDYEDFLPPNLFLRPHQSYIVNNHYIDKYRRDGMLILRSGKEIPVSIRRKEMVLAYMNNLH